MKTLKNLLTSLVFSLAGVAVHSNAATENHRNSSGVCFQTTPLSSRKVSSRSAEAGADCDPLDR